MERGFWIVLIGIAVIALGYAALSVWPVLSEVQPTQSSTVAQGPGITQLPLQSPRNVQTAGGQTPTLQSQPQAAPPAAGAGPAAPPAAGPGGPAPATSGRPVNRRQQPPPKSHGPKLMTGPVPELAEKEAAPAPPQKYTRESVKLYIEPNGRTHSPTSLNGCPLIIARGSHVLPLEYRDGWVMVRSPGNTFGWVHDEDLTDQPPVSVTEEVLY